MKLLSDVSLTENEVNKQLKFNQKISAVNSLLDIYDHMKESDGILRLQVLTEIEQQFIGNDKEDGLIKKLTNEL
jgi:hypothetical protein